MNVDLSVYEVIPDVLKLMCDVRHNCDIKVDKRLKFLNDDYNLKSIG